MLWKAFCSKTIPTHEPSKAPPRNALPRGGRRKFPAMTSRPWSRSKGLGNPRSFNPPALPSTPYRMCGSILWCAQGSIQSFADRPGCLSPARAANQAGPPVHTFLAIYFYAYPPTRSLAHSLAPSATDGTSMALPRASAAGATCAGTGQDHSPASRHCIRVGRWLRFADPTVLDACLRYLR